MAKTVQELQVYRRACEAGDALFAVGEAAALRRRDGDLWSQLSRASVRIESNIAEGFEQKTDRHFASYLYNALGSAAEIRTQMRIALRRKYVAAADGQAICDKYDEVGRMLRGLIDYLERENRPNRRSAKTRPKTKPGEPGEPGSPD